MKKVNIAKYDNPRRIFGGVPMLQFYYVFAFLFAKTNLCLLKCDTRQFSSIFLNLALPFERLSEMCVTGKHNFHKLFKNN